MKYGFVGSGNMAGAIAGGLLKSGKYSTEDFFVYNPHEESAKKFAQKYGITSVESLEALVEGCEGIILAVKPNMYPKVLERLKGPLKNKRALIISLAAGFEIAEIEKLLPEKTPVVRVMPNLNSEICMGVTSLCSNEQAEGENKQAATRLFEAIGMTVELEEKYFGVYSAIAGCSPAFTYLFIDSLAKGAQKMGMKKSQALAIAAQAVMGSAKMLMESGEHPWELIDRVCSPGGLTIEGVCVLEERGFQSAIVQAVEDIVEKDKRL